MTKIVGIDSAGKKPPKEPPACPYCGAPKACPDFTCPRIAVLWHCEADGEWEITFHDNWNRPTDDEPPAA